MRPRAGETPFLVERSLVNPCELNASISAVALLSACSFTMRDCGLGCHVFDIEVSELGFSFLRAVMQRELDVRVAD